MPGFYMIYLESLCHRRGWRDPFYKTNRDIYGYTCVVLVNGGKYETEFSYESSSLAQENAAMLAFMICSSYKRHKGNGEIQPKNGIIQKLPPSTTSLHWKSSQHSWKMSHSSSYGSESGYGTASLASVDLSEELASPDDLKAAISSQNSAKTRVLLRHWFDHVASGEFSWLAELKQLGYSTDEIAEELLEKSCSGPWIFEVFKLPQVPSFCEGKHLNRCLHSTRDQGTAGTQTNMAESRLNNDLVSRSDESEYSVREIIEFLCGIGGARPAEDGNKEVRYGSVVFEDNNATAIASSINTNIIANLESILGNLEKAAGILQEAGGCCDSFTFLFLRNDELELRRIKFQIIRDIQQNLRTSKHEASPVSFEEVNHIISEIFSEEEAKRILDDCKRSSAGSIMILAEESEQISQLSTQNTAGQGIGNRVVTQIQAAISALSLVTQFLALSLLSYAQAHTGSLEPFFLDTPLDLVAITGLADAKNNQNAPCFVGSLVELSCLGDMIGQHAFAFRYVQRYGIDIIRTKPQGRLDLLACPEDLLDTWGPGEMMSDASDPEQLFAISIGGGTITTVDREGTRLLHWSRQANSEKLPATTFSRRSKAKIGAIVENVHCQADHEHQFRNAAPLLEELGTFPDYWALSQRHLSIGLQGGETGVAILQFTQTYDKTPGLTKKAKMVTLRALIIPELDSLCGVEVSMCTGIARRVRLRDLLADVLPIYVAVLITKPPEWKTLVEDFNVIEALRGSDLVEWVGKLDHNHQRTFECLVLAVLLMLQDTGVDRKDEHFVIACIQPMAEVRCFKVPCQKENYWARILADSQEVATFAYTTSRCLETNSVQCTGPSSSWANSTGLFWTAVCCCQDEFASANTSITTAQWVLKHSEAYLIGQPKRPLLVNVERVQGQEPRLLVSLSSIRFDMLKRQYRRTRRGRLRRLRERRPIDYNAESVTVLVSLK